jgi:hypothetical protein
MYLLFLHPKCYDFVPKNQISSECRFIEIIKGSAIVVISSKKELILVNFVSQILPYIQPGRKYMYQSDISSASGQGQIMV